MVLELSKSTVHTPCNQPKGQFSDDDLKKIMLNLMKKKGVDMDKVQVNNNGPIELEGLPDLKIHTIMLEAEKLGLTMKFTRKTVIEVC